MSEFTMRCRTEFRHLEMKESGYIDSPIPLGPFGFGDLVTVELGNVQGTFYVVDVLHTIRNAVNGAIQDSLIVVSNNEPSDEDEE